MFAYSKIPLTRQITRIAAKGKDTLLDAIYPPRCLTCIEPTEQGANLCADCWADTTFITGAICNVCGTPLLGEGGSRNIKCDECISDPPKWNAGRAAVIYAGGGRKAVLGLKHGDRLDMAKPLAEWMARSAGDLLDRADIVTPVPLHWRRLVKRKFNQSAELARHLSAISGTPTIPDLLVRRKFTTSQDGLSRVERHDNQRGVFAVHKRRAVPKNVLLIDDVMTTGATLSACADTLRAAGAERIDALVLARVARDV